MGATGSKDQSEEGPCECGQPVSCRYNRTLLGSVKMYHRHVLICRPAQQPLHVADSWKEYAKIEKEEGSLAARFKALIGASAKMNNDDEQQRPMITACTLPSTGLKGTQDVIVFPEGLRYTFAAPNHDNLDSDSNNDNARRLKTFVERQLGDQVPAEELSPQEFTTPKRVVLVCTHDARDKRCGKTGTQVFFSLQHLLDDRAIPESEVAVVESSHLGGHKYAGVVLVYPEGHWYGLCTERDAAKIVDAYMALPPSSAKTLLPPIPRSLADRFRGQMGQDKEQAKQLADSASSDQLPLPAAAAASSSPLVEERDSKM